MFQFTERSAPANVRSGLPKRYHFNSTKIISPVKDRSNLLGWWDLNSSRTSRLQARKKIHVPRRSAPVNRRACWAMRQVTEVKLTQPLRQQAGPASSSNLRLPLGGCD